MSQHNEIVQRVAQALRDRGLYVRADHIQWPNGAPTDYGGVRPDVDAAHLGNIVYVVEAETEETLSTTETEEQLRRLGLFKKGQLVLAVPTGQRRQAEFNIRLWQVQVDQVWEL